jgi:hypothetical protein
MKPAFTDAIKFIKFYDSLLDVAGLLVKFITVAGCKIYYGCRL